MRPWHGCCGRPHSPARSSSRRRWPSRGAPAAAARRYGGSPSDSADDEISAGAAAGTWGDTDDSTEPSLELAEDGTLSGTDGCNQLSGQWTENGVDLTFENVASHA